MITENDLPELETRFGGATAPEILRFAFETYGARAAIAFSGAEDVVLIDWAKRMSLPFSVFCLDTGRLHAETYRFIERVRDRYAVEIRMIGPEPGPVEEMVRKKGLFSFYEDGHHECCSHRKVSSLRRVLGEYDAWLTGQRRDQSPTRSDVPVVTWDRAHRPEGMLKLNPLAGYSLEHVWREIEERGMPYNALHDQGYVSIGCEPCTRPPRPGEHARAGRWWWEEETKRECGLHHGS